MIDRLPRTPRGTSLTKKQRVTPEPQRRIRMRTFADWDEPLPGNMEMDLVAHCGEVNRGSYVHSLVLTDIASGCTGRTIIVPEGTLVIETLERVRAITLFCRRFAFGEGDPVADSLLAQARETRAKADAVDAWILAMMALELVPDAPADKG